VETKLNALENWYCSTSFLALDDSRAMLPWLLGGADVGDHVLEIGAGAGAATAELRKRAVMSSVLSTIIFLPLNLHEERQCRRRASRCSIPALCDRTFSSAIAVLVLHHLRSREQQDRASQKLIGYCNQAPTFLLLKFPDGWLNRVIHIKSTFVPVQAEALEARLAAAGFVDIALDRRAGGFSVRAARKANS